MNILALKNETKTINYEKNLRKLLGKQNSQLDILEKSHGILKGILKTSAVTYQRKVRQEWEKRLKRQWKIVAKT